MINRTLSVASAAILGLLTLTTVAVFSDNLAYAADECRGSPGAETRPGGHWRYRVEKGTGRKCWYLAGAVVVPALSAARVAETKPSDEPKAAPVMPKPKSSQIKPSVADAHAELIAPEAKQLNESVWPPLQAQPADVGNSQDASTESPQQNITLAQRWPEPNSVRSSDDQFVERMRVAANTPAQAATPVPPAPLTEQDDSTLSPMRIMLVAMIGVLALFGVLLRTILSYLSKRRRSNAPRRPIWDDVVYDRPAPTYAQRSDSMRPAQYARSARERYDDREAREEIEYLLRRAAHRDQR